MSDPLNVYKLIVLYMLDNAKLPLTRIQVFDFLMEKGYVTFFTLQQAINELIDAALLSTESVHNATRLLITDKGRETIDFFSERIPDNIRLGIDEYLHEHSMEMRKSTSISADYFKTISGEYEVSMNVRDKEMTLISLSMSVPTKETAEKMCNSWDSKNAQIYEYLLRYLQENENGTV